MQAKNPSLSAKPVLDKTKTGFLISELPKRQVNVEDV
jgi:hypothetical protein